MLYKLVEKMEYRGLECKNCGKEIMTEFTKIGGPTGSGIPTAWFFLLFLAEHSRICPKDSQPPAHTQV